MIHFYKKEIKDRTITTASDMFPEKRRCMNITSRTPESKAKSEQIKIKPRRGGRNK